MNIAPSTDPTPIPARDDSNVAFAKAAKNGDATPFADLLGASCEHLPDGSSVPTDVESLPRKRHEDLSEPDLAILLRSMLPQVSLTVPLLPQVPEGSSVEMGRGNSGGAMQSVGVSANVAETFGLSGMTNSVTSSVACDAPNAVSPDTAGTNGLFKKPANVAGLPMQSASVALNKVQSDIARSPLLAPRSAGLAADSAGVLDVSSGVANVAASVAPASTSQPLQTGLPITGAAAEISPPTEQTVATPIPALVGAQPEMGTLQRQSKEIFSTASAGESGGTTAAMHRAIMKEQSPERQTRTVANVALISSFQGEQRVADTPEKSSGTHGSETTPSISTNAGLTFEPQAGSGVFSEVPVTNEPKAASEITRQTFDLIERVRVTGRDNAEVRMLLNDGQQVTVSIRLERGEWKPVFKTESEALCRALEQNWNRAVAQPSPQSVKFGTPEFESRSSQSDLGSSSQQHPESGGRERSFNRREQDSAFENIVPFRATGKAERTAHVSPFSEAAAMQLYA